MSYQRNDARAIKESKPMKRDEHDQEDLMREAVSLVPRIECLIPKRSEPVVMGINAQGWLFVYLGSDPMYRFDMQGRLRRAFVDERLYRTTGSTLAVLDRQAKDNTVGDRKESVLLSQDLTQDELNAFRERMRDQLTNLHEGLPHAEVTRQHPVDASGLVPQFQQVLQTVLESTPWLAPALVRR